MTELEYLNLVPSQNREQPDFIATLSANLEVPLKVQDLLSSMIPIFDVDVAVGDQLDIIGIWVGVSRNVAVPIANVYFSWDGDYTVGWDYGSWRPASAPADVTVLPDDQYRILIKAKIAANRWDGTTDGAYAIWDSLFTAYTILIQDFQDMSYDLIIAGGIVDSLTLALLTGGYLPLKPEGVHVNAYFVPVNTGPIFAWDVENDLLAGWDDGSWARELAPT